MWKPGRIGVVGVAALAIASICARPAVGQDASPCAAGGGTLISNWEVEGVPGTKGRQARSTMECLSDGRIRQVVEVSKDGQTWRVLFESTYRPGDIPGVAIAPPAAPVAVAERAAEHSPDPAAAESAEAMGEAPAAQPAPLTPQHQATRRANAEGSEVQALSRELGREEIPEEDAPELVMASPLVLELTPGEVDDYPEGTAWSTDETAGFIVGQVVLKKLTVGRKTKGGTTHIIVGAQLFTKKRQRTVDVLLEAMLDGEVVASESLRKVRVGLNIPGHGKNGLLINTVLDLPAGDFERLFADGAERKLRVTLTVPSG